MEETQESEEETKMKDCEQLQFKVHKLMEGMWAVNAYGWFP